jgi:hypothetical protein
MDVRFLKDISEAYVIDSGLKVEPNQIFEELYDVAKFLQAYDSGLYNELYESTKLQQQRILKNYLDITYEQELLTEVTIILPAGLIVGGIIVSLFGNSIAKTTLKVAATAAEGIETLGKWLARHGKYWQIRYSIVQENTRKCYALCGVQKPSDLHVMSYFTIKNTTMMPAGQGSLEQGKCLRECYIEETISTIGLHMENYFACLKKTGSFDVVQKTDSDDIMKMVSSTNVAAACESYYTAAREALDNFYRIIEMVYDEHSEADKRLEKINKLRTKVYESRQIVQNVNQKDMQRYGQASFKPPQQNERQGQVPFRPPQQNNNPNFRRN